MGKTSQPPKWIKPQLTRVVDEAPAGDDWLHEIKYDGYRMHARLDNGKIQLLTRTGLDWSRRYRFTIEALRSLPVKTAYLDGELCALRPDGVPAFSRLQAAMDEGRTDDLVFIAFDLLYLNGKSTAALPLIERKERLRTLFARPTRGLRFSDHVVGNGRRFHEEACRLGVEGVISKRVDRPYALANRGPAARWLSTAQPFRSLVTAGSVLPFTNTKNGNPKKTCGICNEMSSPRVIRAGRRENLHASIVAAEPARIVLADVYRSSPDLDAEAEGCADRSCAFAECEEIPHLAAAFGGA